MTEKTIAKFKYENTTYKLLEITIPNSAWDEEARTCYDTYKYMILKNRKRLCTTKWINTAKQKFTNIIAGEIMQTKLTL